MDERQGALGAKAVRRTTEVIDSVILDGIGYGLSRSAKRFRDALSPALARVGLHLGQELLLAQLWREDGLSQSELAARLRSEPATVSRTVSRLSRTGMIETQDDPGDLRTARVYLTARGRSVQACVEDAWRAAELDIQAALGPSRKTRLERLLRAYARLDQTPPQHS